MFGFHQQWAFLSHSCSWLVHGFVHCFLDVAPTFPTIPTSSVLVLAGHSMHWVCCSSGWYVPMGQAWHWLSVALRNCPATQTGTLQSASEVEPGLREGASLALVVRCVEELSGHADRHAAVRL